MKNIKKWYKFLNESEQIEFPLKKYLSIIKDKTFNKLSFGETIIEIDFKNNEYSDSTLVRINIEWVDNDHQPYHGQTDILSALQNEFKKFDVYIIITDKMIDWNKLYSTIQHELKHIYDVLYDESQENTFLKVEPINRLKLKYKNINDFYSFIHLVYESLKHELEARNAMIYDRFRWLNIYDKSLIKDEFKNTYIYKSLVRLSNFDSNKFIRMFDIDYLINITNDFIEIYGDYDRIIKTKTDLYDFYNHWEVHFKEQSEEYLSKSEKVIDEIIKDSRPYMESKLTTEHLNFDKKDLYKEIFTKQLENL
jgi:hypothetical protein